MWKTILAERLDRLSRVLATYPQYSRAEYQYWLDRNPIYHHNGSVDCIKLNERLNLDGTNDVFRALQWTEMPGSSETSSKREIVVKICKHFAPKGANRHHRLNMLLGAFQDEIRINNLVRATNIEGVVQSFGGGVAGRINYLKMEYIKGHSLDREFRTELSSQDITMRMAKLAYLANTISQLHYYQVIHKDLKPKNLLLCKDQDHRNNHKILVCDFGYANAKLRDSVTEYGGQLTPVYSAPEQALMGENLSYMVDYFSYGVIMHEYLTGVNLFPKAMEFFVEDRYQITDRYLEHLRKGKQNRFTGDPEIRQWIEDLTTFDSQERLRRSPNLFHIAHRLREKVNSTGYRDVNTDFLWNQLREYQSG